MGIAEVYHYYLTEMADPRTNSWFLMGSPVGIVAILSGYLYFVLVWGPRFMENRKPYKLKTFISFYNIFQIVANAILVYQCLHSGWLSRFGLRCEPVNYSLDPMHVKLLRLAWWLLILKVVDLIETAIFILRKKHNQVSVLHVYHHVSTVVITWACCKYIGGGMFNIMMLINCAVHVIMYTYYYLSSCGPKVQNVVTSIKPYITLIQMAQFLFLILHTSQGFLPSCPVPKLAPTLLNANVVINFYLFYKFYKKSYSVKPKQK